MNIKIVSKLFYILPLAIFALSSLAAPHVARADIHSNVWSIDILKGPLISCTGAGAEGGTDSKNCTNLCDLVSTAANLVYFGIGIVIWIVTPIMFAWSGMLFLISRGSTERTGQARKMITGTVIGLLIVLCAYLIVSIFISVLGGPILGIGGFGGPACTVLLPVSP